MYVIDRRAKQTTNELATGRVEGSRESTTTKSIDTGGRKRLLPGSQEVTSAPVASGPSTSQFQDTQQLYKTTKASGDIVVSKMGSEKLKED